MEEYIVVDKFSDNGEFSHEAIIHKETGSTVDLKKFHEASTDKIQQLEAENKDTIFFLKSMITENLDHSEDSHRYETPCLVCEAEQLLKKITQPPKEAN